MNSYNKRHVKLDADNSSGNLSDGILVRGWFRYLFVHQSLALMKSQMDRLIDRYHYPLASLVLVE